MELLIPIPNTAKSMDEIYISRQERLRECILATCEYLNNELTKGNLDIKMSLYFAHSPQNIGPLKNDNQPMVQTYCQQVIKFYEDKGWSVHVLKCDNGQSIHWSFRAK